MKNQELKNLIANIIKAVKQGENSVLVTADSITEEEIEKIRRETGISNIKNIAPYYTGTTFGKAEEYEKFMSAAVESSINKFTHKTVFHADGSLGVKTERSPLFVVIYATNGQISHPKKPTAEFASLKRYLPSFYYHRNKTSSIVFAETAQYIKPSDFYTPCFKLEDITLDELYADLEEIGTKDVGDGILHLFQSKKYPFMYKFYEEQKYGSYDHEAGYHWSSNSATINAAFGTKIMEVTIYDKPFSACVCAMAADKVAELIPSEYEIVKDEVHGETVYKMKKANNQ